GTWSAGACVMSIGTDRWRVGPNVNLTSASDALPGKDPCSCPVVGSSAAHVWLGSLSSARAGLFPRASVEPSVVQRTRQPRAMGNSRGAELSTADCARGLSGIWITPGCAIARDIAIPLEATDPARTVAVSIDVRRDTPAMRSVPVPSPRTTLYARPNPI